MTALAVRNLSKSFGGLRVTASLNLAVEPGERRLIIGPNGAGKTTLFNLITGELRPDSGSIQLFGQDVTRIASRKRAHLGMARTYQIITLFPRDTILRNAMLALLGLSPMRWNAWRPLHRQQDLRSGPARHSDESVLIASPIGRLRKHPTARSAGSKLRWR